MRKQYENIYFNNETIEDLYNIVLENEIYSDNLIGSIQIIEEKISGRDLPYFYKIDRSPLEFELSFALLKPKTKSQIKSLINKFTSVSGYSRLQFGNNDGERSPIYNVIFTDDVVIDYIKTEERGDAGTYSIDGKNPEDGVDRNSEFFNSNQEIYDGYYAVFKLNARCNAPYGFLEGELLVNNTESNITQKIYSDFPSHSYRLVFENTGDEIIENYGLKFTNCGREEIVYFSAILPQEKITMLGDIKRVITNIPNNNVYTRWNRVFPVINKGETIFSRVALLSDGVTFYELDTAIPEFKVEGEYKLPRVI